MDDALNRARRWVENDPDPRDREELGLLINAAADGDVEALREIDDRMNGPLVFGTAGLRGQVGAGQSRMNTAVVTTATAGLCAVLQKDVGDDFHVVIGYDARHRSDEFARTVAGVVTAAGGKASLLPHRTPTPVLAFAVGHLGADAGVMVTASHNPPADNGYKVYLGGRMTEPGLRGSQLVAPMDGRIFTEILATGPAGEVPLAASGWQVLDGSIEDEYVAAAKALFAKVGGEHVDVGGLRVVLTAMHGVGANMASRVLAEIGVTDLHLVDAQCEPDPDFPTVSFPNPEEPGAIDMAVELARSRSADLVVALDPDADRCSLAVPEPNSPRGWSQLTGDQVGALLGEHIGTVNEGNAGAVLARSIASSSLLAKIAKAHGLGSAQTLTGFKWIARAEGIVFGYEEAIGYCLNPSVVKDKDGITATVVSCVLAAIAKRDGASLLDTLDRLAIQHGLHATSPLTFRVSDLSLITRGLEQLQADPPRTLAGARVIEFFDLSTGYQGLEPTEGYRIETDRQDRVLVRPSGTEAKLKCYLEVIEPVGTDRELGLAKLAASERLEVIKRDLTEILGF